MGSAQSSLAPEYLVAGTVTVAAGAVTAYRLYNSSTSGKDTPPDETSQQSKKSSGSKRGKKKADVSETEFDKIIAEVAAENAATAAVSQAKVVAFPDIVPGSFEHERGSTPDSEAVRKEKKTKKKKGKKVAAAASSASASAPIVTSVEGSMVHVPLDTPAEPQRAQPAKKDKKKKNKGDSAQNTAAQSVKTAATPVASKAGPSSTKSDESPRVDDETWTRVGPRRGSERKASQGELPASDTNLTTSVTDNTETSSAATKTEDESSPVQRTFVERMLPKPRKTGVEDMEEEPLQPTLARVIRVAPSPNEKPAKGFSWGDYEDVSVPISSSQQHFADGESSADGDGDGDDGWGVVKRSRRSKFDRTPSGGSGSVAHVHAHTAPETLTKRQRQNIARREAQKEEKAAQEALRLARLTQHKRELERVKIDEQWSAGKGAKKASGGMVASVNENGSLVWD